MDKKTEKIIKTTIVEFLEKLIIDGETEVTENDGAVKVKIETAEPGILIGRHGRNLEAIQILLGQIIYKKLGTWTRIIVSVGDYRDRREKQLQELALNVAQKVTETKEQMFLSDLSPAERRIVHIALAEHPQVVSASEGEGRNRQLIIKMKT